MSENFGMGGRKSGACDPPERRYFLLQTFDPSRAPGDENRFDLYHGPPGATVQDIVRVFTSGTMVAKAKDVTGRVDAFLRGEEDVLDLTGSSEAKSPGWDAAEKGTGDGE